MLEGEDSTRATQLRELPFDREDIVAMMLDGASASPDAYIRADLSDSFLDDSLRRYTVPLTIRMSSQVQGQTSLIPVLSRVQMPVFLIGEGGPDASASAGAKVMAAERLRLHPDSTMVYQPQGVPYLKSFPADPAGYMSQLDDFIGRFLDRQIP